MLFLTGMTTFRKKSAFFLDGKNDFQVVSSHDLHFPLRLPWVNDRTDVLSSRQVPSSNRHGGFWEIAMLWVWKIKIYRKPVPKWNHPGGDCYWVVFFSPNL